MKVLRSFAAGLFAVVFCLLSIGTSNAGSTSSTCSRRIYRAQSKVNRDTARCTKANKDAADLQTLETQRAALLASASDDRAKRKAQRLYDTAKRKHEKKVTYATGKCAKAKASETALNTLRTSCTTSGSSSTTTTNSGNSTTSSTTTTNQGSTTTTTTTTLSIPPPQCSSSDSAACSASGGCYNPSSCQCLACSL